MSLESGQGTPAAQSASAEEQRSGQRLRLLDDPRSIRALAHPLRLELEEIVGRSGRITTADAARELGISHGLASHHLHQLAKYGFVERAAGSDHRERPWRLVATSLSHEGLEEKPGGAAAVAVYEQVVAERALENFLDWQDRRSRWSAGWREHSGLGRSTVYLTEDELAALVATFEKLISDYTDQRPLDDLASRPPGSVPVDFSLFVVPREPTSGGH
jgi:DNA-binding MarR family transcriptional regulator